MTKQPQCVVCFTGMTNMWYFGKGGGGGLKKSDQGFLLIKAHSEIHLLSG